jgi:N-acyl-L-homoserine lactone synthetase
LVVAGTGPLASLTVERSADARVDGCVRLLPRSGTHFLPREFPAVSPSPEPNQTPELPRTRVGLFGRPPRHSLKEGTMKRLVILAIALAIPLAADIFVLKPVYG